jgi:tetratricopeptide (TPR) repeat protein
MLSWRRGRQALTSLRSSTAERSALIHRENLQLVILLFVAVAAFLVTRAVASNNHDMTLRDAAEWYHRGQAQLAAGRLDDAIDSFRRATVRDRNDKPYVLALAQALTLAHDYDGARRALLALRESAPEDPDVNLQMARLAAERLDATEAVRYYRNTLYAPWPPEQIGARRQIRVEFIQYLLDHDQAARAQAELIALATDLPDDASLRVQAGQLFARAADDGHALDQFQRAIGLAPTNADALDGAGLAAFRLHNYPLAQTYLHQTAAQTDEVTRTREIVDLILSSDPLAGRIGSTERQRRFVADVSYAQERFSGCQDRPGAPPDDEGTSLTREVGALADQVKASRNIDLDGMESGMDLIERAERYLTARCGPATTMDEALLLIAGQHRAGTR